MIASPPDLDPPFLYVGGEPALDLINTVDWTSRGPEAERLVDYGEVIRWAEGAGVVDPAGARHLRRIATQHPRAAASALEYVLRTRAILRDLFAAIARDGTTAAALPAFNALLAQALEHLEMAPERQGSGGYGWRWRGQESDPRAVVWPVVWSAAELLKSGDVKNVRICDGDDCGWMYVDRSRNGFRRWCQMRTCGTREKTRRRRETAGDS
jgi:predicted RNA-binding Zn ribbon-like protein